MDEQRSSADGPLVTSGGAQSPSRTASPSKVGSGTHPELIRASQIAKDGNHEEALTEVDRFLTPYSKAAVSVEAVQAAAAAVRLCNELALTCMRDAATASQLDSAYSYLKWALKAPHASPALRAVTLNNAGIYYARTNNPQAALRCLERVGRQGGVVVEDDVSIHVTLNMTTVLADLGRHQEALEKAQEAVKTLTRAERAGKPTDASLLSAAYHNLAVQQERLGNKKGHVRSYRAAVLQARKTHGGGAKTQMATFMEQAYSHARQRANQPGSATSPVALPPVGPRGSSSSGGMRGSGGVGGGSRHGTRGGSRQMGSSMGSSMGGGSGMGGGGRKPPPRAAAAPYVSLDDVYSGAVPAAAVPIGAVGGVQPAIVPPPGMQQVGTPSGERRHAPRSAGTARITAAPAPQ